MIELLASSVLIISIDTASPTERPEGGCPCRAPAVWLAAGVCVGRASWTDTADSLYLYRILHRIEAGKTMLAYCISAAYA